MLQNIDAPPLHSEGSSTNKGISNDEHVNERIQNTNKSEDEISNPHPHADTTNSVRRRKSRKPKGSRSRPKWMDSANTPTKDIGERKTLNESRRIDGIVPRRSSLPASLPAPELEPVDLQTHIPRRSSLPAPEQEPADLQTHNEEIKIDEPVTPKPARGIWKSLSLFRSPNGADVESDSIARSEKATTSSNQVTKEVSTNDLDDTNEGTEEYEDSDHPITPTASHGTVEAARLAFLKQKEAGLLIKSPRGVSPKRRASSPKRADGRRTSSPMSPKPSDGRRALRSRRNSQT